MDTVSQTVEERRRPPVTALEEGAPGPSDGPREGGRSQEKDGGARARRRPEHSGSPVETPTRQFPMLVLTPVALDKLEELRALLKEIGEQTVAIMRGAVPDEPTILPFLRVKTIHYARFVLIERRRMGARRRTWRSPRTTTARWARSTAGSTSPAAGTSTS